jgi:hypothetical protein
LQEATLQLHEAVQFAKAASSATSTPGGHWAIHDLEYQAQWYDIFGNTELGCWPQLRTTLPR